ncbi:uncharacterized protein G2W53_041110 [Senna tora]|uniref:Uncharacterized protein n=1 Tax=Senna tora TaxID=362788 RepID=A0A834SEN8_9FABA|nr:uncharacterized protein G2W53_041110 [Senna tora]
MSRMHYSSERRELEPRKESETYRLQLAEKQSLLQDLMAKLRDLEDYVTNQQIMTNGKAQVEDKPDNSRASQPNMIKYRLRKSVEAEGAPKWKSKESSGKLEKLPEV